MRAATQISRFGVWRFTITRLDVATWGILWSAIRSTRLEAFLRKTAGLCRATWVTFCTANCWVFLIRRSASGSRSPARPLHRCAGKLNAKPQSQLNGFSRSYHDFAIVIRAKPSE